MKLHLFQRSAADGGRKQSTTCRRALPSGKGWQFETKYDGFGASPSGAKAELFSNRRTKAAWPLLSRTGERTGTNLPEGGFVPDAEIVIPDEPFETLDPVFRRMRCLAHKIINAEPVTQEGVAAQLDAPMLPELLGQISAGVKIGTVAAGGAYDTRKCRDAVADP